MPTHASLMPLAMLSLLAGCGPMVDDPKNVPLRGRWQQETKIVSLVANDVWIDRDEAPFPLPRDKSEIKNCFEPRLKTADEINDDLLQGTAKNCKFGEIVRKGHEITSEGVCAATAMGPVTVSGKMEFTAHEAADSVEDVVSATMFVKTPDGASQRVRFGAQSKWKRLGDCGT